MKISVCGKGGSGKSTLVTLLANQAQSRGMKVLVIDSDESNTSLHMMLGFTHPPSPLMELLGGKSGLKQRMKEPSILSETQIKTDSIPREHIVEKNGLALVSIGKILQSLEGCACPMGLLSREFLSKLTLEENEIAIVDMEAGVEHFGRGIDANIDVVLLVVDPSFESIMLAERIKHMSATIEKKSWAILTKIDSERTATKLANELQKRAIEVLGTIPNDPTIFEACLNGNPLSQGESAKEAGKILDYLLAKQ